ncbi:MAG: hypothetical protein KJZ98_10610 [Burkholderiaceae bacterium]|nr:hypothetical protein [Burkholderiaceae bacterium]MEB2350099.1 hypothetical protein [Burkholderiaceae bacterium]
MDWSVTRGRIRADFVRTREVLSLDPGIRGAIFLMISPATVGPVLHRLSHHCHVNGMRSLGWLVYLINLYLTGMDVTPASDIGEGLFVGHANGIAISARIGRNAMLLGQCAIGGGRGTRDVGGGPGLPVVGDDVMVGFRATILGPLTIGDRCMIGACSLVIDDVPPNTVVAGNPARRLRDCTDDDVAARRHG